MATKTFVPLLGKRLRVTKVDECGAYPEASTAGAALVTSGFVRVALTAEVEDGDEIIKKRADGSICVNEKQNDSFKYFNVEIEFCGVNPSLLSFVSNAVEYENAASDVAGFVVPEGEIAVSYALELWTGLAGEGCGEEGSEFGYMLFPFIVGGVLGDFEVTGEDTVDFSVTGGRTKGGHSWGKGPWKVALDDDITPTADVLPTALDPFDHFLMLLTAVTPPAAADEPIPMPT